MVQSEGDMLYQPTTLDDWEWQRVDRLILSDTVLYYWWHWIGRLDRATSGYSYFAPFYYRSPYELARRELTVYEFARLQYNIMPPID